MRDMIFISSQNYDLVEIKNILEKFSYSLVWDENSITIDTFDGTDPDYFFQLEKAPEVEEHFEPEELEMFRENLHNPQFYSVHFRDISFLKKILKQIANREDVFIDNDNYLILKGNEFIAKCDQNPSWDWAYERLS